jgi:pimeloyl-ACP methyl ester carboxylesterase
LLEKERAMTQVGQRPTAACKENHVEVNGFRIRYWEAGPPQPARVVVMLEGMSWGLSTLRDALVQRYRVIALELPGFGASPANTRSQSVQELANTMAQATAQVMPETYTLIGTSFGANVALWQTLQSPDKVEALVLIAPTALLPTAGPLAGTPEEMARRLFAHPDKARGFASVDTAIVAKEQALVQRLTGGRHDAEAECRLGEIPCATLVLFGAEDKMVAPEAARIYRAQIPNSNIAFVYDAGHLIEAERPEALVNAVSDYVELRETFIVGRQTGIINPKDETGGYGQFFPIWVPVTNPQRGHFHQYSLSAYPLLLAVACRLIDLRPRTGGVQSDILPFSFALLNKLSQHGTGQERESPAVRHLTILFASEVIERRLAAIITPDFRHTQGSIDRKLGL